MSDFQFIADADYSRLVQHFIKISRKYQKANPHLKFANGHIRIDEESVMPIYLSYNEYLIELEMKKELSLKSKVLNQQERKYILVLIDKKIRFLKNLHREMVKHHKTDTVSLNVAWIIFLIDSLTQWDYFVNLVLNKKILEPKNTRPAKGYKPYKISSKIIFNRNGGR